MELQVIGAGFGRTGTLSMKQALEQLGLGPCHHMLEVAGRLDDAPGWASAIRGESYDVDGLLGDFRSSLDFPSCVVWERTAERFPEAKILLTVRSSDSWWRSFDATIRPHIEAGQGMPDEMQPMMAALRDITFRGAPGDRATAVGAFEAHNADVIDRVPADRLLVYEVGSGWEPLCAFLGLDVPDEPFPRTNTSAEWAERAG